MGAPSCKAKSSDPVARAHSKRLRRGCGVRATWVKTLLADASNRALRKQATRLRKCVGALWLIRDEVAHAFRPAPREFGGLLPHAVPDKPDRATGYRLAVWHVTELVSLSSAGLFDACALVVG